MNQTNSQAVNQSQQSMLDWFQWAQHQQMIQQLNPEEVQQIDQTKKEKKKSPFQLFKLDNIVELKKQHPEFGYKERLDTLKQMWKSLTQEKKFYYVQKSKLN